MSLFKKRSILKLAAIFMAVSMMAGTFAMHGSTAFAAPAAVPCNNALFIQGNCDMTVSATATGDVTFANDAAVVLGGAVVTGPNPFTFNSIVQDQRTIPAGWSLTALSTAGLHLGAGTPIPLFIGGTPTTVCTSTSATTPTPCPTVTGATLTDITTTALKFASAASIASPHGGIVTVTTPGSFTLPATAPPGDYTGIITISLTNAP